MGRDRKNETRGGHYTQILRSTIETDAWRALKPVAQALYPWLRLEWRGPDSNNNGRLRLSVRQASEKLGVSRNTAASAFHDLQAKGFLYVTRPAQLGVGGAATGPLYELTELALPGGAKHSGRKCYLQWQEGHDFTVNKAAAHNPTGSNGKTVSRLRRDDGTVTEFRTRRCGAS